MIAITRHGGRAGARSPGWAHLRIRALMERLARFLGWRVIGLVAAWSLVTTLGHVANAILDFPALRAQIALVCGALSSAMVLAERWDAASPRLGRGCAIALAAGAASGWATLA